MTPLPFAETILAASDSEGRYKRQSLSYLAFRICALSHAVTTGSKPDRAPAEASSVATGRMSGS